MSARRSNERDAEERHGNGRTAQAPRADVAATQRAFVAALGRIEPGSEIINIGPGLAPDRLDSLFVARGDTVKKGQVLGYLGGYSEQVAQLDMYRSQLEEARLRLKTEIELNHSRIESAETLPSLQE